MVRKLNIEFDHWKHERINLDSVDRILDRAEKTLAEIFLLRFVPARRMRHFGVGFRMETILFQPSDE